MKKVFAFFFLCAIGCSNEEPKPEFNDQSILGFWNQTEILVNGQSKDFSSFIGINNDHTFDRPYISGTWELKSRILELNYSNIWIDKYELISSTSTRLVLKRVENNCEIDSPCYTEFQHGEKLTIIEDLVKN